MTDYAVMAVLPSFVVGGGFPLGRHARPADKDPDPEGWFSG
jgi:hypothetical protein